MFSSRPDDRPRDRRRRLFPLSLRGKLIAQLIFLLALVCLVVGISTEVALSRFLLHQLDDRLTAASERGQHAPSRPGGPPGFTGFPGAPPPDALRVFGQGAGTLAMHVSSDGVIAAGVLKLGPSQSVRGEPFDPVSQEQVKQLSALPPDSHKYTLDLGGQLGDYRLVSVRDPDGGVTITGLPLADVSATRWQLALVFGGVALGALLVAGAVGAVTFRRTTRPLDRLAHTAAQVSELPLDKGEVALSVRVPEVDADPRTEIGKVGVAFNRMLGHVDAALAARHESENRVRQFVADASHELRTPLAAIRGYAELTRRSGDAVPPDVAFAIGRVESESARMTKLVEELLLLARLDAGRHRVYEPVGLARLVADAVADAHVSGPDHRWLLNAPPEEVTVLGDANQLHQVVTNLLTNARTHTPPGTEVTTKLLSTRGQVTLTVEDNGPGIPPEVLPEVFERFARGDTSRSRAAGSTGLGLAIVAAVVAAHNGQVGVASRPGRTEFTVRFPAFTLSASPSPGARLRA
ncbi:sensor histidine kinase [Amycolatopsis pigmentata]|uniref:histidine kinase n=1 Tax=Amycolatopsis pigmentata TaxID=450801 RepID=A0ABW5FU15_9PSEU